MTEQKYESEDLLQQFLAQYPSLLAGDQIDSASPRRWLLISRETPVPYRSLYWPIQEIQSAFRTRCQKYSLDPDTELLKFLGEEEDPETYWEKVKTNLKAEKVRLVFVADVIPSELQRIIEFLNGQMDPAEVIAIEIKQYAGESLRTLVPRVIGKTAKTPPPPPPRQMFHFHLRPYQCGLVSPCQP